MNLKERVIRCLEYELDRVIYFALVLFAATTWILYAFVLPEPINFIFVSLAVAFAIVIIGLVLIFAGADVFGFDGEGTVIGLLVGGLGLAFLIGAVYIIIDVIQYINS